LTVALPLACSVGIILNYNKLLLKMHEKILFSSCDETVEVKVELPLLSPGEKSPAVEELDVKR
jgi:hypothetical protein